MIRYKLLILTSTLFCFFCTSPKPIVKVSPISEIPPIPEPKKEVLTGLENFLENYIHLVKGKRVGLVTNPSAINKNFQLSADLLYQNPKINLVALFGVEHGIRGDVSAGQKISDLQDAKTGLPVFSLYGTTKKPTKEMLQNIDVIIFDIQDVGVRSYTYISSMGMIIEAAAENNIEMIILDRPNPLGGIKVEGNVLNEEFKSHVGYFAIPYRHGMTIGEIAQMHNSEYSIGAKITVIPMQNWQREMLWNETYLPWVATSPHVPHWQTTLFLPMTGTIGELQIVNIGVGYTSPFELIGAPWMDADILADSLNFLNLPGLYFRPTHYKPYYATFKGELCHGVQIYITDSELYKPYSSGLYIMATLIRLYPDHNIFKYKDRVEAFNLVMGGSDIYKGFTSGKSVKQMELDWQKELSKFLEVREKYLLY